MIRGKIIKRHAAFICILFLLTINHYGQQPGGTKYPQGYFRNPLGIPMELTANFGELRPNHWHMGFDIRTDQKTNLPVIAAADGYVAQIGVRPLSFGRFMIINHPNGYSTLYGHLNEFYPELENFVKAKQVENESWPVELEFSEKMFVVKKGDLIAKSGNTGGSQGPHLHFEIRDTKSGNCLNPSLFGFGIKDNIPPVIKQLAIYDRSISTYFQTPLLKLTVKTDSGYFLKPDKIITKLNKLSFAIETFDRLNGSAGTNGIYGAILYLDNVPQIQYLVDNIQYAESINVNAHIDWKFKTNKGIYLEHLSRLPGFNGSVYTDIEGSGIIELKDTAVHTVKIEVFDTDENQTQLSFKIQHRDSLVLLQKKTVASKQLVPRVVNVLEEKDFEVFMPEKCFYDTLPLVYFRQNIFSPGSISAQHRLNDPQYPVNSPFIVRIKPENIIPDADKEKVIMQRTWGDKKSVRKTKWQNGWFTAEYADFGNFQLFLDKTAPQILPPVKEKDTMDFSPLTQILLTPTDNFGIKSFRAELDGKWLMFTNDKVKNFIYIFDEQCPFGNHELKLRVEDLAGNITEKTWYFKKNPYTPPPKKKARSKKKTTTKKKTGTVKK
jgi:murein DD-endopeptidase MepM/ murein hydrolase activator NlpD